MADKSKFSEEAERLARKAESAASPSEKRMLETHSRFYEALADEPDQEVKVYDSPVQDAD
jgi:hypothetical protein